TLKRPWEAAFIYLFRLFRLKINISICAREKYSARPPTKNFSPYTHGVSRKKVGKSEQTPETPMGSMFPCSDSCSDCSDCADSQRLGVVRDDRSRHHGGHHPMVEVPRSP